MGVHKNSIKFPNESDSAADTTTVSSFGNGSTGFTSGFGRQNNTVFGTFPNQNNQQQGTNNGRVRVRIQSILDTLSDYEVNATNNSAAFGSQNSFGNNFFHNPGFFQPKNFGFGCSMSQQTTNICFTDFGEPKTNYCFTSFSGITMKKVTLVFEQPDLVFGSSIFRKPDTIVEIEAFPINNRTWISNMNDFSFSVGHIEKYNSLFIMKSANPIKLSVKVKQSGASFNNNMSSSMNYGNRKISLTFQSEQPQYIANSNIFRPLTVVEIPIPFIKYDPMYTFSNEDFMFSVGPTDASNSFEVQTSKNSVFKVTFAEAGRYNNKQLFGNRQTRTSSVFFDQGRQMNSFPTSSGLLFGQGSSGFGGNQCFGSSTSGNNGLHSNQVPQINSTQNINGSLFGKPSISNQNGVTSGFGANQSIGNSINGTEMVDKTSPNTGGSLFGQTNKCYNSQQTVGSGNGGEPVFGQLYGNAKPETICIQPTFSTNDSVACAFGANQSSFPNTFAEAGRYNNNQLFGNRQTRTSSVFFDQGRQMNAFPTSSGLLFGQGSSGFRGNQCFGSSTSGNGLHSNQVPQINSTQNINGSLFGKPSISHQNGVTSGFGANQSFGNSINGTEMVDKTSPNTGGSLLGQTNKCYNSQQTVGSGNGGEPVFGQLFGNAKPETICIQPTFSTNDSVACAFGANQSSFPNPTTKNGEVPSVQGYAKNDFKLGQYQPTFGSDELANHLGRVQTKPNCITAMSEYANYSLEELRLRDYSRNTREPSSENNMTTDLGRTQETVNSSTNTFVGYNPSQNMMGNTNQAFFDQLHQLIPYLNAGSFCKCVRSCNAQKNQNNSSALTNSQPATHSDSLANLYVNTQNPRRLNDNITIDEFYEDVFKYLEYIQKQYRHLESTLNNKNANNIIEADSNKCAAHKPEELNKTSNQNTQNSSMQVFGCSTYSALNTSSNENSSPINPGSENDAPIVDKVASTELKNTQSNMIAVSTSEPLKAATTIEQNISKDSSPIIITSGNSDDAVKIKEASKTEDHAISSAIRNAEESEKNSIQRTQAFPMPLFGCAENTKNNSNVETTKSSLFGSGINNKRIALDITSLSCLNVRSQTPDKTLNAPILSIKDVSSSSTFPTFSTKDNSSSSTGPIFATKVTISSSTGSIFSTKDISSSSTFPTFSTKDNSSSSTGPIFAIKDTISSTTGSIFSTKDISSSSTFPTFSTQDNSSSSTGPIFATKDTTTSSTGSIFSTGDISSSGTGNIFSTKAISCSGADPNISTKNNSGSSSIFSTKDISSSGICPIVSTKDINSSSTGSIFATNNINFKSTGSIFSSKDIGSSGTGPVFGTSSNSRLGNNPIGLFSFASSSKTPENSSTTSNVASNDTSSSSTVGEKSTGFLSFALPSSKPENKFIAPIFSTKDTLSFGIAGYNFLNQQINVSEEDFVRTIKLLKLNDSSANKIFQKESENGGSSGDFNIVKPDNSLQCNKTQGGPSQSLQIASMQEKSDQMDEQGGCVSSQAFKMKKISEILADINEGEEERKESFSKSDTESDISNYSLISNRSSNEDCKQYASPIPTEAHPTGIVMTRYGYYILPSLEDLKSQITEDGVCVVTNFTIGRKGYGSISFNKEINVAGLNVNDIVHFRNKEIIIYPNEGTNPQIVADLKKCDVLVTLEQVWPHDETKHKLIKDPQLLDKIKYEDKLRSVCHKNNVHFVDYRPETGSWLFKMKQFTKTNINCWDVEDEYNVENKSSTGNPKIL